MNADRKTGPRDAERDARKEMDEKLCRLIEKYGEQNANSILAEVRRSILEGSQDDEKRVNPEIDDTALEAMYRDYVALGKNLILTFIEYKTVVKIITDLEP